MRAAIALVALLAVAGCARRPTRWIGMDRAAAACSWEDGGWRQTCVAGGRRYTCIRGDDRSTWQCAPLVVVPGLEARP